MKSSSDVSKKNLKMARCWPKVGELGGAGVVIVCLILAGCQSAPEKKPAVTQRKPATRVQLPPLPPTPPIRQLRADAIAAPVVPVKNTVTILWTHTNAPGNTNFTTNIRAANQVNGSYQIITNLPGTQLSITLPKIGPAQFFIVTISNQFGESPIATKGTQ